MLREVSLQEVHLHSGNDQSLSEDVSPILLQTSSERITWLVSWSSAFFLSADNTRVRVEEELEVFGVEDVVNGVGGALGLFLGWSILYIVMESYKTLANLMRFIKLPFCNISSHDE